MQHEAKGFILVGFPKNPRMSSIFNRQVKWPEKIVALEVDNEVRAYIIFIFFYMNTVRRSKSSFLSRVGFACEDPAIFYIINQSCSIHC